MERINHYYGHRCDWCRCPTVLNTWRFSTFQMAEWHQNHDKTTATEIRIRATVANESHDPFIWKIARKCWTSMIWCDLRACRVHVFKTVVYWLFYLGYSPDGATNWPGLAQARRNYFRNKGCRIRLRVWCCRTGTDKRGFQESRPDIGGNWQANSRDQILDDFCNVRN